MNEAHHVIEQAQLLIENLYALDGAVRIRDFMINKADLRKFLTPASRIPRELFLVRKKDAESVELALFLDHGLLTNLVDHNPFDQLDGKNLSDFCVLIEGISHFVYYLSRALHQRSVTQLEMELQAEIDKFIMPTIYHQLGSDPRNVQFLFNSLFENFHLHEHLANETRTRYLTASRLASQYCYGLRQRFDLTGGLHDLLTEIRYFYHLPQEQKIQHILN